MGRMQREMAMLSVLPPLNLKLAFGAPPCSSWSLRNLTALPHSLPSLTSHLTTSRVSRGGSSSGGGSTFILACAQSNKNERSVDKHDDKQSTFFSAELGLQALVVVFTLGFIDAGYSGDWSRIGVLSKDAEATLRLAAYGVVPVSIVLTWFISKYKSAERG